VAIPRDSGQLALVIEHLQRDDRATIIDLTHATGWLPHTVRAATLAWKGTIKVSLPARL
jgi:hypothetical protein